MYAGGRATCSSQSNGVLCMPPKPECSASCRIPVGALALEPEGIRRLRDLSATTTGAILTLVLGFLIRHRTHPHSGTYCPETTSAPSEVGVRNTLSCIARLQPLSESDHDHAVIAYGKCYTSLSIFNLELQLCRVHGALIRHRACT